MAFEDIRVEKADGIAVITIDRPKVLNAIRYVTMLEIDKALDDIEEDESIRVLVITGAGDKAFISGGDISIMARGQGYVETLTETPKGQAVCTRIEHFPKPVIARINGFALGGGTEVALSCDIRIAAEHAILGLPEIKLGIIPGYGGTQRLPRLVGMGKAKELIMTGDHISAMEALNIGLVNHVVPKDELDVLVSKMAGKIASKSPIALHMAKASINNGVQADLRTGLDYEARCFSLCFGSEDRVEGTNAFMEKRKPKFTGR
ncbi:enoyl-CoA hydratase [Desulfatibacillum alkenivorans DSM 16219]|jgi:enoyl-CoA hydratase|uniref:Enoyl-CoA hydratase n=1 Tax=Desulfatibacillum alkenivorans DSM 16219 TaxID=1121393 RepID=A0A1M6UPG3_9BACT|nr:enoyl-CoA hydratase-related protein [Desulfatibacillum alkenivorans]SHK71095.1 enoyl-CoA hydratase [Desulfatibacillum alkenivorans DSM 16219]